MTKTKQTLFELLVSDEFVTLYTPNPALQKKEERRRQILETIDFMTSAVPPELVREDLAKKMDDADVQGYIPVLQEGNLELVLKATHGDYFRLINLAAKCFFSGNSAQKKRFTGRMKSEKNKASVLTGLQASLLNIFLNPSLHYTKVCNAFGITAPQGIREAIEANGSITNEEARKDPTVIKMQVTLIDALMKENKEYLLAARNLPYAFLNEDPRIKLNINDLFGVDTEDEVMGPWSRLMFGFFTCHIGYFQTPQFGKWEEVYSQMTRLSTAEVMDRGLIAQYTDTPVLLDDVRQQLTTEAIIISSIMTRNGELRDTLDTCMTVNSKQAQKIALYEREKILLTEQVETLGRLVENERQLAESTQAELTERLDAALKVGSKAAEHVGYLEEKQRELEHSLKQSQRRINKYEKDLANARDQITFLEEDLLIVKEAPQYEVVIDEGIRYMMYQGGPLQKSLERAVDVLSRSERRTEEIHDVLIEQGGNHAHTKLKRRFPQYDTFFKFRGVQEHRVLYVLENGNSVRIIDAMPHRPDYDRLCSAEK